MNERVAAVVESFRLLTDQEMIDAFLEIEEQWKALQAKPDQCEPGKS